MWKTKITINLQLSDSQVVSAAPSPFALIDDKVNFVGDTIDNGTHILNSLIEKTKCSLDVIGYVIGGGELSPTYKKFRANVETILKDDVNECVQTRNAMKKFKWVELNLFLKLICNSFFTSLVSFTRFAVTSNVFFIKCFLSVTHKINTLNVNFLREVLKVHISSLFHSKMFDCNFSFIFPKFARRTKIRAKRFSNRSANVGRKSMTFQPKNLTFLHQ